MNPTLSSFVGGDRGDWTVRRAVAVSGDALAAVAAVDVVAGAPDDGRARWVLRGVVSHDRYVTRAEKTLLAARSPPLGRPEATYAALIPIKKSDAWWAMTQDERRAVLEERSRHIAIGGEYLPAIARRLHHGRDLGEPFDFITWFEYRPEDEPAFDEFVARLRRSDEWRFVEREIDIRLVRTT